jgi:hypothetical protein
MNNNAIPSETASSENSSRKADEMLPFGSKLALDTIQSLARKIGGRTVGDAHEWAREIERLTGQLIDSYEKQSHRLEEWARGIGPYSPSPDRNCPS